MNIPQRTGRLWLPIALVVAVTSCSGHATTRSDASDSSHSADAATASSATASAAAETRAAEASTPASPEASPASAVADNDTPAADDAAPGTPSGHLRLTGDVVMERDFVVETCAVAPPGDGLLSGYKMNAQEQETIPLLNVAVKDFSKDGTYTPADKTEEGQVAQVMTSGTMGPLTLFVVGGDSRERLGFMMTPKSKLDITISDDGAKGDATFSDLESQPTMADFHANASAPPHGKVVSGSATWTCAKVDHLNPKMNDAVNSMFKSLIH